uniref:F-box domain-containing protein n=1 Tax=Oryza glumipatula TaxID=40148 RepID=A0A0E0AI38_9ORYZ
MATGPSGRRAKKPRLTAPPAPAAEHRPEANDESSEPRGGEPPAGDGGGVDYLSLLPDDIAEEIITLLPTKDAARIQALASRWRALWRSAPLDLDYTDLPTDEAHARLITRILSGHRGPARRFSVDARHLVQRPDTVAGWLRSASLDKVQEIRLLAPEDACPSRWLPQPQPLRQKLPPASIFHFSSTLRVAALSRFRLSHEMAQSLHFPQLKLLQLQQIYVTDDESLHCFVAGCATLEALLLDRIYGLHGLQINSSSIKSIGVRSFSGELKIVDAPSLERLLQLGDCRLGLKVSVISAPKLETLGSFRRSGSFSKFDFGTAVIEVFHVVSLATAIQSVKILAVSNDDFVELNEVIDLMRCFPCLEKFYIEWLQTGGNNVGRRKRRNLIKCSDIPLKTVVVGNYHGGKSEINFATFFLLNARMLESLKLIIKGRNYGSKFFTKQRRLLQMGRRASRQARVDFRSVDRDHQVFNHVTGVQDLSTSDPFECQC